MIITLLAAGTRGDVQPYLALGVELKKAGHRVRVATFENFKSFVTSLDLEFFPIPGDVAKIATGEMASVKTDNPFRVFQSFRMLQSYVFDLQKNFYQACVGSDAVVYHPGAAIGYFAAQELKIPSILATPFPMTPTRAYPAVLFYDKFRLGPAANWLSHKITEQILWFASNAPIKKFWKQEFGRTPTHFGNPFPRQTTRRLPTIISCSPQVFARPSDWPEHIHQTGYWFLDDTAGWTPPDELQAFLERGAPPVYVGFGSIGDQTSAAQTTHLVSEALRLAGQRGLLATGWSGMEKLTKLPESIFRLESAPHSWLFPRMAAVVHHGGAGTTAAGLRAGMPTVIIPHGNDQFAWGRRVFELGVGARPVPRKELTAEKLAEAIRFALSEPVRERACELGTRISAEKGAESAAQVILNCLTQS